MTDEEKDKPAEEIEYISGPGPAQAEVPKAPNGAAGEAGAPAEAPAPEKDHGAGAKHLKEKLKKREAEIRHLKKEMEELKDQYVRKLADTENLRKRLEREKSEYLQFALSEVLLEFLGILDNFERALQAAGDADGKTLREGVELIYRMTQNFLVKRGVQPIEIKDGAFDPALHHAVAVEESAEVKEPHVTEVMQKGYLLHNRLLRPSLVKVAVPKKD
jgi:molecular chaperone GrpE